MCLSFAWPLAALAADDGRKTDQGNKQPSSGPAFAFVCLNDKQPASEKAWKKSLQTWLQLKSEDEVEKFEMEAEKRGGKKASTISFDVDGRPFVVGMMDVPVPKDDIDYAVMNSFMWPQAEKVMAKHKSHMIVMALGNYDSPPAKSLALSRVIAAATECHNTAGVYWGHAATVHAPKTFREMIAGAGVTMETVPTIAWVGFLHEAGDKKGTVNFYTRGLSEFGAKELEILNSRKKPAEVLKFLTGLCTYLMVKGDVIKDGQVLGGTSAGKVMTRWADSHIGLEGKVIRLDY